MAAGACVGFLGKGQSATEPVDGVRRLMEESSSPGLPGITDSLASEDRLVSNLMETLEDEENTSLSSLWETRQTREQGAIINDSLVAEDRLARDLMEDEENIGLASLWETRQTREQGAIINDSLVAEDRLARDLMEEKEKAPEGSGEIFLAPPWKALEAYEHGHLRALNHGLVVVSHECAESVKTELAKLEWKIRKGEKRIVGAYRDSYPPGGSKGCPFWNRNDRWIDGPGDPLKAGQWCWRGRADQNDVYPDTYTCFLCTSGWYKCDKIQWSEKCSVTIDFYHNTRPLRRVRQILVETQSVFPKTVAEIIWNFLPPEKITLTLIALTTPSNGTWKEQYSPALSEYVIHESPESFSDFCADKAAWIRIQKESKMLAHQVIRMNEAHIVFNSEEPEESDWLSDAPDIDADWDMPAGDKEDSDCEVLAWV